jgi:tRNA (guanosine-2'-O-)-methyltransferase
MTPARYQRILEVLNHRQPDLTLILEGVHKPHNLSAIQRTADAVGVLDMHAVSPDRPYRSRKGTAVGSQKWVRVHNHATTVEAVEMLQQRGFQVAAAHLSERACDFRRIDYSAPTAILMGTEKYGVSETALALADAEITIPMAGMVASLNVSVAAAVILYEAQRQRELAGCYEAPRLTPELRTELLFRWGYPRLAQRYDNLGLPYPRIGDDGALLDPVPAQIRRVFSPNR